MSQETISVNCGEALTISHAMQLHQKLRKALEKSSHIELEAADISKVDTAGLQLLASLHSEIEKVHGSMQWSSPSETLIDAARVLGLKEHLSLENTPETTATEE